MAIDTVQQFYNAIKIAQDATYKYQMDVATWEENYGEKTPPKATFEERLRIYQREADQQHTQRNYHSRDKSPFFRRIIHFFTFLYSVGVKEYILLNVLQK